MGGVFFGLELHITSYGLLGLAGVVSFFLGSLLLFRGEGMGALPYTLILPTVAGISLFLGLVGWLVTRAQLRRPASGVSALVGQEAVVRFWSGTTGKVFVHGELWQARSARPLDLISGRSVVILAVSGMVLDIGSDADHPGDTL